MVAGDCQVDVEDTVAAMRVGNGGSVNAGSLPYKAVAPNINAIGGDGIVNSYDIVGVNDEVEHVDRVGVIVGDHNRGVAVIGCIGDTPIVRGAPYQIYGFNDSCSINLGECREAGKGQKQTE